MKYEKYFFSLQFYPRYPVAYVGNSYTKKRQLYHDENARANTAVKLHRETFDSIAGDAY